jgi:hypothetical protein
MGKKVFTNEQIVRILEEGERTDSEQNSVAARTSVKRREVVSVV